VSPQGDSIYRDEDKIEVQVVLLSIRFSFLPKEREMKKSRNMVVGILQGGGEHTVDPKLTELMIDPFFHSHSQVTTNRKFLF